MQKISTILSFVIEMITKRICFYVCYKNAVYKGSIQSWASSRLDSFVSFRVPSKFYNERSLAFNLTEFILPHPPHPEKKTKVFALITKDTDFTEFEIY